MLPTRFTWLFALLFAAVAAPAQAGSWWDGEWKIRKQITLDLSSSGTPISEAVGETTLLIRLHDGNFQFEQAKENGDDLRFVKEDDKTLLPYHIEKWDGLLHEAFVWVRLPEVKANEQTKLWLYYGNAGPKAVRVSDPKVSYDAATVLVYHFAEHGAVASDATGKAHNSVDQFVAADALIGGGARFTGSKPINLPPAPDLAWKQAQALTWSAWVKPMAAVPNAIIFSRRNGNAGFTIGLDNGSPYVDVSGQRTGAGAAVTPNTWQHLAVVASAGSVTLYLNGEKYAEVTAAIPALDTPAQIGAEASSFTGDLDELAIANNARPAGWVKLAATIQAGDKTGKTLVFGADEQTHSWFEGGHFGIIIKNLTGDAWAVIAVLGVMFVISWWLMITKIGYLNSLSKGNALFMKAWGELSTDLTALDHGDQDSVRTLGGRARDPKSQRYLRRSAVYRIYHVGSQEIRHRLDAGIRELPGRSIQAIRAALDGTLVREKQKIDRLTVLLTICISGGPFLGLLGTVVGVMITFAEVAAAGEVNVNAIAPGIAAALLATVAGLAVAIPALFGYNYILSRVKDATADMHVFIDEFISKMAEFYSEPKPARGHRAPQHEPHFELEGVH
jgi:biopolymer transport protein ExbB